MKKDLCPSAAVRVWQYLLFVILVFAGQSCNVNIKKLAGSMATPDHDRTCGFFDHVHILSNITKWAVQSGCELYALMIEHLVMGSWLSETPFALVEFCDLRFVPEADDPPC